VSNDWLPPRENYIRDHASFDKEAREAIKSICADLQSIKEVIDGHGLSTVENPTWLEVKRGPLEFVAISFNFDTKGGCRIVNHIEGHLGNKSHFDFKNAAEGKAAFKEQLKVAVERFYQNISLFAALGLA
jgi:hypothetical protein